MFGGNIAIRSPEVVIEKYGKLLRESVGEENSGNIILDVAILKVLEGGEIFNSTVRKDYISINEGTGGNIHINASELVCVSGVYLDNYFYEYKPSYISSYSEQGLAGGSITISSSELKLLDGGAISTSVYSGQGGNIYIKVSDSIYVSGFYKNENGFLVNSIIYAGPKSHSDEENPDEEKNLSKLGHITIKSPEVVIEKYGEVSTFASSDWHIPGNIILDVGTLKLLEGGHIDASIENSIGRNAGDIEITAYDSVYVSGFYKDEYIFYPGGIYSESSDSENSVGGNITLKSPEVMIDKSGIITAASRNAGPAGDISITGNSFFNFSGSVQTTADSSGGGSITFNMDDIFFLDKNAAISTSVSGGSGNGGNITIARPDILLLRDSSIKASAKAGDGGNISLASDYFIRDDLSAIDASSELGIAGNIDIDSPNVDLNTGLLRLTGEYKDLTQFLHNPCLDRMLGRISTLTVGPRIVKRKNPFAYLESDWN